MITFFVIMGIFILTMICAMFKEGFSFVMSNTPAWVWILLFALGIYLVVSVATDNDDKEYSYRFTDRWLKDDEYRIFHWDDDDARVVTSEMFSFDEVVRAQTEIRSKHPDTGVIIFHAAKNKDMRLGDTYALTRTTWDNETEIVIFQPKVRKDTIP